MVHVSEQGETSTRGGPSDRLVVQVVTTGGEMMLLLAFLAAGIVLSAGTEAHPASIDEPWIPVVISLIGAAAAGLAVGSGRSGRLILENWGANISLLAAIALLFRLFAPVSALWFSGTEHSRVDVTPFAAAVVAFSVLRTVVSTVRSIVARFSSTGGSGSEHDWQIIRGRWVFTVGMLCLLLIAGTL